MPRQYIGRSVGFVHEGVFVQINPHLVGHGTIDGDGLYGDKPFDSFGELKTLSTWTDGQMQSFGDKLKEMLA